MVAVESRRELATLLTDILDSLRCRVDESNRSVSSSEIGEGPGTGGSGDDGGPHRGGFGKEVDGDAGMKDGGLGKDSRRTGGGRVERDLMLPSRLGRDGVGMVVRMWEGLWRVDDIDLLVKEREANVSQSLLTLFRF